MSLKRIESIAGDTHPIRITANDDGSCGTLFYFVEDATYTCEVYTDALRTALQVTLIAAKSWNGGLLFTPDAGMVAGTYYVSIKQDDGSIKTISQNEWLVK